MLKGKWKKGVSWLALAAGLGIVPAPTLYMRSAQAQFSMNSPIKFGPEFSRDANGVVHPPAGAPGILVPAGAVGDGSHDDSPAFQSTINTLGPTGGAITLTPGKIYSLSASLAISTSNILFVCPGGGGILFTIAQPVIGASTGCWFKWNGAAGSPMITIISPTGTTSNQPLQAVNFDGISFDGNNGLASSAIAVQTLINFNWDNLFAQNMQATGPTSAVFQLDINKNITASNFGSACVTQGGWLNNVRIANYGFADTGIYLGNYINSSIGGGGCNASLNHLNNIFMNIGHNQSGFVHDGDDNNFITNAVVLTIDGTGYFDEYRIQFQSDSTKCPGGGSACYGPANNDVTLRYSSNAQGNGGSTPVGSSWLHGQGSGPGSNPACIASFGVTGQGSCVYAIQLLLADTGNNTQRPGFEVGAMVSGYSNTFGETWTCARPHVDVECFGAKGDDAQDDTNFIRQWISAYLGYGSGRAGPLHLMNKVYKVNNQITIDLGVAPAAFLTSFEIDSDGADLDGSANTGSTTFVFQCSNNTCVNDVIRGRLTIKGANNGPVAFFGTLAGNDHIFGMDVDYIVLQGYSAGTGASGLQIGNMANSRITVQAAYAAGTGGAAGAGVIMNGNGSNSNQINMFGGGWQVGGTVLLLNGVQVSGNTFGLYGVSAGGSGTCVTTNSSGVTNNTFMPFDCANNGIDYNFTAGSGNVLGPNPLYGAAHGGAVGLTKMATTAVP